MKKIYHGLVLLSLVNVLNGCVSGNSDINEKIGEMEIRTGVVEHISRTQVQTNHDSGVGAIIGGTGGAALGSLVGGGSGRDVAMIAGALAGGVGGNYIEQRHYDKPQEAQQVIVRMNNGVLVSVIQPVNINLRKGEKVYIEGQGAEARVLTQGN
ncbi:glycine zipper 2TM domain-containing protein [Enterobacter ludwigii]